MTISNAFKALSKSEKLKLIERHKGLIKAIDAFLASEDTGGKEDLQKRRKGHVKQMNKLIKSL